VCPCNSEYKQLWFDLDQQELREFSRTKFTNDMDDDDGSVRLFFQNQQQGTTFQACNELIREQGTNNVNVRNELDQINLR